MVNIRLFLAINFPGPLVDGICGVIDKVRQNSASGRFVGRENVHLTLEFLGEVEQNRLPAIRKIMDGLEAAPFELRLSKIGHFKRPEGDIYWIGIEECPALFDMQKRLHGALAAEGFALEERKFTPHITIGRKVRLKEGFSTAAQEGELRGLAASVDKIDLMRSQLTPNGPIYTVLYSKRLAKI